MHIYAYREKAPLLICPNHSGFSFIDFFAVFWNSSNSEGILRHAEESSWKFKWTLYIN